MVRGTWTSSRLRGLRRGLGIHRAGLQGVCEAKIQSSLKARGPGPQVTTEGTFAGSMSPAHLREQVLEVRQSGIGDPQGDQ